MSAARYQHFFSATALFLGVMGLSGCPVVTMDCSCDPEFLPLPETPTELVAHEIQDTLMEDGDSTHSYWPDNWRSPFSDILEMNAIWEEGTLIVDYTTEEGDFQVIFVTERAP